MPPPIRNDFIVVVSPEYRMHRVRSTKVPVPEYSTGMRIGALGEHSVISTEDIGQKTAGLSSATSKGIEMGQNQARRQKKIAKQKQKRQDRRSELARQQSNDPTDRLAQADRWPIVETLVSASVWDSGIGYGIITRRMTSTKLALGNFLIDRYCLGVKNCFWKICTDDEHRKICEQIRNSGALDAVSPEFLSKLVHCAADYAQSIGFPPHDDFRYVRLLLDGIDPSLCDETFEFGKDGKPLYIAGPYDTPERARLIAARVQLAGGEYLVGVHDIESGNFPALTDERDDDDDFADDQDNS